jgi:hypothetical protein
MTLTSSCRRPLPQCLSRCITSASSYSSSSSSNLGTQKGSYHQTPAPRWSLHGGVKMVRLLEEVHAVGAHGVEGGRLLGTPLPRHAGHWLVLAVPLLKTGGRVGRPFSAPFQISRESGQAIDFPTHLDARVLLEQLAGHVQQTELHDTAKLGLMPVYSERHTQKWPPIRSRAAATAE